ncbi:FadR family transcriptional regulator [Candidatus Bipolaricaulota bacterium]|nr:FadR family transcriptional regulator [Candidatus Bipolaricaulota bacterium]
MNKEPKNVQGLNFEAIDRKSTVQKIVEEFTNSLIESNVSPGEKIPSEKKLMAQFDVSRGTIRQALQILISMGVLASVPGKGYYVTRGYHIPLKTKELQDYLLQDSYFFQVLEARRMVEKQVIKLAVKKATQDDYPALDKALEELKDAEHLQEKLKAAENVHLKIAECARNDVLVGVMKQLMAKVEAEARKDGMDSVAAYKHHKELVDKVKEGNLENLDQAVDEHLEFVREEFMRRKGQAK